MRNQVSLSAVALAAILGCSHREVVRERTAGQADQLATVASFTGVQVTGVTVTERGRIFANFPRWREGVPYSVVEVDRGGGFRPYPDEEWNRWSGRPVENHFACVQSVVAHRDVLYVLDPSHSAVAGVTGPSKLFVFDLETNTLKRKYEFSDEVAPEKSYLNDLRVEDSSGKIYITDSGLGAIVVLDIETGRARRFLSEHPSTKAEGVTLQIGGRPFLRNGEPPRIHSDGIELDQANGLLYFHALTGYHLYRMPTKLLVAAFDDPAKEADLDSSVEDLGRTPAPDGMVFDRNGNLYFGDLESDAVVYREPGGEVRTLARDPRIRWADSLAIDEDRVVFTISRIHEVPQTGSIEDMVFPIYALPLPAAPGR